MRRTPGLVVALVLSVALCADRAGATLFNAQPHVVVVARRIATRLNRPWGGLRVQRSISDYRPRATGVAPRPAGLAHRGFDVVGPRLSPFFFRLPPPPPVAA